MEQRGFRCAETDGVIVDPAHRWPFTALTGRFEGMHLILVVPFLIAVRDVLAPEAPLDSADSSCKPILTDRGKDIGITATELVAF